MDQDNKPRSAGEIARKQLDNTTQTYTTTLPQNSKRNWTGLERSYVIGIFGHFASCYGNVWTSQLGSPEQTEEKMRVWAKTLAGVSPQKIGEALKYLPAMPPSAPGFRALCRDSSLQPSHKPFQKALPKPPPDIHKGKAALSNIKHTLRKGTKEDPEYVPPERVAADEFAFDRGHEYEERKARGFKP